MTPQTTGGADADFGLRYADLLAFLGTVSEGSERSIESRFRKLRTKFAPDNLQTNTGNRVNYDVSRVLAIGAVYLLNGLGIPQGHAVDIVVANWPEVATSCVAAWRQSSDGVVADIFPSSSLRIYVDAFDEGRDGRGTVLASWADNSEPASMELSHLVLDTAPLVSALAKVATDAEQAHLLQPAFEELARDLSPSLDIPREIFGKTGSAFFSTGPYFHRARTLLATEPGTMTARKARRLQAYLRYLEAPPLIDAWKAIAGTDERASRLGQTLAAWGAGLGLRPTLIAGETMAIAAGDRERALKLIELGETRLSEALLRMSGKNGGSHHAV